MLHDQGAGAPAGRSDLLAGTRRWAAIARTAALLALLVVAAPAVAQDAVFKDGFEPADIPATDAEAARFLTQATFGPNRAQIANLRTLGRDAWITQQMAIAPTLARPYLENQSNIGVAVGQPQRMDRWFHTVATGNDQLRQRVAWALSQILVVSDNNDNLVNDWPGIAEYWDHLARGAFGSYRELLETVTRSPQMGKYLSHWRNRKASATTQPDENFAREVMQLFSIGLEWRNPDFSLVLDGMGNPVPTYNQAVVTEIAQVFTGFGNRCPTPPLGCNPYSAISSVYDSYEPMACFPLHHDTSTKLLFDLDPGPGVNQVVLPAGPTCDPEPADGSPAETQCFNYCDDDLDAALDALATHPNVAPFLSRQLIQRLVASNPSPAYVQRVSSVFTATNGNLGATVRAILLDEEANTFDPGQPDLGQPPNFGKLREPLLRVTALWRAFNAQPGLCVGSCLDQSNPPPMASEFRMGLRNPEQSFSQRPIGSPTVFNFYEPDYRQPGAIADLDLYSPEFQITNETTVASSANDMWYIIWSGYSNNDGTFGLPTRNAYYPPAEIDALPTDAGALVDELNVRLLYGSMSGTYTAGNCAAGTGMKGVLYKLLQCDTAGAEQRRKVLGAIHLIAISPEFSTQR